MSTVTAPAVQQRHNAATDGPQPGYWVLDADRSTLQIGVKVGGIKTVHGRFAQMSGAIMLAPDTRTSSIDVVVNTDSLTSGSSQWDAVLKGAGLVDAAANPTIGFRSLQIRPKSAQQFELDGVLSTTRGDLDVTFELRCLGQEADRLRFNATGSISSKDAVALLSQPGLDRIIGRRMTIDLTVEAVRSHPRGGRRRARS